MRTLWIGGPYHATEVEKAVSGTGKHIVSGAHGPHGYVQFLCWATCCSADMSRSHSEKRRGSWRRSSADRSCRRPAPLR